MIRQLARQTVIYGGSHILNRVLNYIFLGLYLTHRFSQQETADYTTHGELYFYIGLLLILLTLRMETTFFRFAQNNEADNVFTNGSTILGITSIGWLLVMLLSYESIAEFLDYGSHPEYILIPGLVLSFDVLIALPMARFRHENRAWTFAILRFLNVAINVGALLFFLEICPHFENRTFVASWYNPDLKLTYVLTSNLLASGLTLVLLLPQYFRQRWTIDIQLIKKMLGYAWPLILVGFAGVINQSSFTALQKYLLGGAIVDNLQIGSDYLAATKIALLMSLFTVAFNYAAEPFFFNQAKKENAPKVRADVSLAYTMAACVILLLVGINANVFGYLLGEEYRANLYVVPWLMLSFLLLGLYYNFSIWYKLHDKTIYGAFIALAGAGVTLVVNIVWLPFIGIEASVVASLLCYFLMNVLCIWYGRKLGATEYPFKRIAFYIILTLLLLLINASLPINDIWQTMMASSVFLLIFAAVIWLRDRTWIKSVLFSTN